MYTGNLFGVTVNSNQTVTHFIYNLFLLIKLLQLNGMIVVSVKDFTCVCEYLSVNDIFEWNTLWAQTYSTAGLCSTPSPALSVTRTAPLQLRCVA